MTKKKSVNKKVNFKLKQVESNDLDGLSIRDQIELRNAIRLEIDRNVLIYKRLGESHNNITSYMEDHNPFFEEGMIYCTVTDDGNFSIETDGKGIPPKQLIEKFCAFLMDTWG